MKRTRAKLNGVRRRTTFLNYFLTPVKLGVRFCWHSSIVTHEWVIVTAILTLLAAIFSPRRWRNLISQKFTKKGSILKNQATSNTFIVTLMLTENNKKMKVCYILTLANYFKFCSIFMCICFQYVKLSTVKRKHSIIKYQR